MQFAHLVVLCVEDDPDVRHIVKLALSLNGGIVSHQAATAEEAIGLMESGFAPDLVLLDDRLPGQSGSDLGSGPIDVSVAI